MRKWALGVSEFTSKLTDAGYQIGIVVSPADLPRWGEWSCIRACDLPIQDPLPYLQRAEAGPLQVTVEEVTGQIAFRHPAKLLHLQNIYNRFTRLWQLREGLRR